MAKKKKRSKTTRDDVPNAGESGVHERFREAGDTVYIGVSRHEIHGVQVAAFALVWKDSVHPEYDEAIVSRNADALSDEDVALRAVMHAIRTSNPGNTLIVYTRFPRISDCMIAAERTIRGCRLPESPDAATVIKMIKERSGRVIGHVMTYKEDLALGYRATALATNSRKRAQGTAIDHPILQSSARQSPPKNDSKLESNSDNVSYFMDPNPATMGTRVTSTSTFTSDIRKTSTAQRPQLINGMHPDRLAMLSNTASSSNTNINAAQPNIQNNQRNRDFGPVIISSMGSNSNTFTTNDQSTSSSSHLINGMHPDRIAMISRPEANSSTISSSSSDPFHHAMDQTVLHNRGSQVSSILPMRESITASNNDSSGTRMPSKRKRKRLRLSAEERLDRRAQRKLDRQAKRELDRQAKRELARQARSQIEDLADIYEDAIDRGWDLGDENEPQQQRPIASSSTTPYYASHQPTADNAPQQPISDNVSQQPISDNVSQQPISDNVSQQHVSRENNQGWLSWIRNIFS